MSELRAAAERLRDVAYGGGSVDLANASPECLADMWELAKAWIVEHDISRCEPATVEIISTDLDFLRTFMSFLQFSSVKPNTTTIRFKN